MTLAEMLATPGFYEVYADNYCEAYFRVEVEADGTCHQLTPNWQRDGVLSRRGWHPKTIIKGKVTPPCDIL